MIAPTKEPVGSATPDVTISGANDSRQNRTREMQLIPEALARAHMRDRLREAEVDRQAVRLVAARRMQRRAERASLRARRALAMAVMHGEAPPLRSTTGRPGSPPGNRSAG